MIKSQVVTVTENASGVKSATVKDASPLDAVATALSTDSAVTGLIGLSQRALFFIGGMAVQSKLKADSYNFLK